MCHNFDFSDLPKVQQIAIKHFCENLLRWRGYIFLWSKKKIISLLWRHKELIYFCPRFEWQLLYWQSLSKVVIFIKVFRKFWLKTTIMESNIFCLTNPCWWLQLWQGSSNVSFVWFLNLFGVEVVILNLPKVQQATIMEFLSMVRSQGGFT